MNEHCVLVSFERYEKIGRICPECTARLTFTPVSLHAYFMFTPVSLYVYFMFTPVSLHVYHVLPLHLPRGAPSSTKGHPYQCSQRKTFLRLWISLMLNRKTETCSTSLKDIYFSMTTHVVYIIIIASLLLLARLFLRCVISRIKWLLAEAFRSSHGRSVAGRQADFGGLKPKGISATRLGD